MGIHSVLKAHELDPFCLLIESNLRVSCFAELFVENVMPRKKHLDWENMYAISASEYLFCVKPVSGKCWKYIV